MKVEKASEKLKGLEESLGAPVKLSEMEKEKFQRVFKGLHGWIDDLETVILEKDSGDAYRYTRLLLVALTKVDIDYIAGVAIDMEDGELVTPLEPPEPVVRPTKEQVDGWLEQMPAKIRRKAITLVDCLKQYNDPESEVGIKIICNHCSREEMEKCIRIADPSITDATTVFMAFQQAGP